MPMFKHGDDAVATADTEAVARPTDAAATADDTPAAEVAGVAEDEEPRAPEKEVGYVAEFKIGACFTERCSLEPIGKLNEAQMVCTDGDRSKAIESVRWEPMLPASLYSLEIPARGGSSSFWITKIPMAEI